MAPTRLRWAAFLVLVVPVLADAQQTLPLRQSRLDATARDARYRVPLDSVGEARWLGGGATAPRWDAEGAWIYFQFALDPRPVEAGPVSDPWWRVSRDGRRVESVPDSVALNVPATMQHTRDASRAVWFHRGELRYWRRGTGPKLLLHRAQAVTPRWSPDEREVRFISEGDLWAIDPETGVLRQLTRAFTLPDPPRNDRLADALRTQQTELFEFVRRRNADRDTTAARAARSAAPMPIVIPRRRTDNVGGLDLSADGRYASFLLTPQVTTTPTTYSDYVNESGVVSQSSSRPKVGAATAAVRVGIVKADPFAIPDSVQVTWADTAGFAKPVSAMQAAWSPQGTHLVVDFLSHDFKDRWIVLIDPETGRQVRVLEHLRDDAWLVHYWTQMPTPVTWLPDGSAIAYTSEAGGWHHLWLVDVEGRKQALTSGPWEVRSVQLAREGTHWWLQTSLDHPSERHLYRLPLRGGAMTRVDQLGEGQIQPVFAPDEGALAFRYTTPEEMLDIHLMPTLATAPVRVTRSGTDAFYRIAWPASDFVEFRDDRGDPVWARVYRPARQHPNRPALFEIHGAGYTQGVHKAFANPNSHGGALYAKYMTDLGATYVVLDYRASAGYGRDTRAAVYRSMGDRDVASGLAAIRFLEQRYRVNPRHVGLFGCSYGGFYTLMALFKHPGVFQAGAAQCSVTDWAHYNHPYTSRILNGTPVTDSLAYKASSPIYFAEGLRDRLLLQHGLVDGNVQYQDAVRLVQRLMELGKDFEFVTYPVDAHGWFTKWARNDSYRRMDQLWRETILRSPGGSGQVGTGAGRGDQR